MIEKGFEDLHEVALQLSPIDGSRRHRTYNYKYTDDELYYALSLTRNDRTLEEIADMLGRSREGLCTKLRSRFPEEYDNQVKSSESQRTKIKETRDKYIECLRQAGLPMPRPPEGVQAKMWKENRDVMMVGLEKAIAAAQLTASERMKARWNDDPKFAEKQRASAIEREFWSGAAEKRWADPDARDKQSVKLLAAWEKRPNKSGLPRGVKLVKAPGLKSIRYAACIWQNGRSRHLGCFDTIEEANRAYQVERDNIIA